MRLLGEAEVHIRCVDPARLSSPSIARLEGLLAEEERRQFARVRVPRARLERIVARALLRIALSDFGPLAPEAWRFEAGPHGRLALSDGPPDGLDFNLTHTEGLCAIALARAPVGIDAESIDRAAPLELASRYFASAEAERFSSLDPAQARLEFFRLWTLKEAFLKARGSGLSDSLAQVSFEPGPGVRARFDPSLGEHPARWQFVSLAPTPHHLLAVAVRHPGPVQTQLSWAELER